MVWSICVNNTLVLSKKKMNGEITTVLMFLISIVNVHSLLLNVKDLRLVTMSKKFLLKSYLTMITIMMVTSILKMPLNPLT
jgi:hypothetical protein